MSSTQPSRHRPSIGNSASVPPIAAAAAPYSSEILTNNSGLEEMSLDDFPPSFIQNTMEDKRNTQNQQQPQPMGQRDSEGDGDDEENEHNLLTSPHSSSSPDSPSNIPDSHSHPSHFQSLNPFHRYCWSQFVNDFSISRTKRILTISCLISLMFIIASMIYFYISLNNIVDNFREIIHTDNVKVNLLGLKQSLTDAESLNRGMVILGNVDFNKQQNNISSSLSTSVAFYTIYNKSVDLVTNYYWPNLYRLTVDNPFQTQNLLELRPLLSVRILEFQYLRNNSTVLYLLNSTLIIELITKGSNTGIAIEAIYQKMLTEENRLLDIRERRSKESAGEMLIIMFISLILCGISILAGLGVGFDSDSKQLNETNRKLEYLLKKAREATKVKSIFLANMSHEIRTPMNGVFSMAELLQSTELSAEQQDIVDTILTSAKIMLRLINDLLLFSKIDSGSFNLRNERFDLESLLTQINEVSKYKSAAKGIEYYFVMDSLIPHFIYSDSGRLRQVLVNLIDNAIKFTRTGSVTVKVRFIRRSMNKETPDYNRSSVTPRLSPSNIPPAAMRRLQPDSAIAQLNQSTPSQPQSIPTSNRPQLRRWTSIRQCSSNSPSAPPNPPRSAEIDLSTNNNEEKYCTQNDDNYNNGNNSANFVNNNSTRPSPIVGESKIEGNEKETKSLGDRQNPNEVINNSPMPANNASPLVTNSQNSSVVLSITDSPTIGPANSKRLNQNANYSSTATSNINYNYPHLTNTNNSNNTNTTAINTSGSNPLISENYQDWILFQIIDTGIGIPLESSDKLFEPFAQLDMSATKEFAGTGLGLSISKHLVSALGGNLRFKSKPGSGSTFSFAIPISDKSNSGSTHTNHHSGNNTKEISNSNVHRNKLLHTQSTRSINNGANKPTNSESAKLIAAANNNGKENTEIEERQSTHRDLQPQQPYRPSPDSTRKTTNAIKTIKITTTNTNPANNTNSLGNSIPPLIRPHTNSSLSSILNPIQIELTDFLPDSSKDPSAIIWHDDGLFTNNSPPLSRQISPNTNDEEYIQSVVNGVQANTAAAISNGSSSGSNNPVNSHLLAVSSTTNPSLSIKNNISILVERSKFLTSIASQTNSPVVHELKESTDNELKLLQLNSMNSGHNSLNNIIQNNREIQNNKETENNAAAAEQTKLANQANSIESDSKLEPPPANDQTDYSKLPPLIPVPSAATRPDSAGSVGFFSRRLQIKTDAPNTNNGQKIEVAINNYSNSLTNNESNTAAAVGNLPSQTSYNPNAVAVAGPVSLTGSGFGHSIGGVRHSQSVQASTNNSSGFRMLLAEDNLINQKVARKLLERDGHTVLLVENGELALNYYLNHSFDIDYILMDWFMPVRDGLSATAAIRDFEKLKPQIPQIPIIAVTASALSEDRDRCINAGVDDIINKPIETRVMREKIEIYRSRALERRKFAPEMKLADSSNAPADDQQNKQNQAKATENNINNINNTETHINIPVVNENTNNSQSDSSSLAASAPV